MSKNPGVFQYREPPVNMTSLWNLQPTSYDNLSVVVQTEIVPTRDENLAKIEISVQAVILFLALLGNSMVLIILGCRRRKLSRMNLLILHLAIADLFVAMFNILPQLVWDITYRFYGNDFLCRSVKYLQVVAMYASSYVLLTTAVDRYLVICHPLRTHTWTSRQTHMLVGSAWVVSFLFSVPQLLIFSYQQVAADGTYDCWGTFEPEWTVQLYITWFSCAVYVLPFCALAALYGRICVVVWRSMMTREPSNKPGRHLTGYKRVTQNGSPSKGACEKEDLNTTYRAMPVKPRAHVRTLSQSKIKTVKLTLTVVLCYLICWAPFFVAQLWGVWDTQAPHNNDAMVIVLLLASLNSCTNPWIYMAFSDISGHVSRWCQQCSGRWRAGDTPGRLNRSGSRSFGSSMYSKTETSRYYDTSCVYGNAIALKHIKSHEDGELL